MQSREATPLREGGEERMIAAFFVGDAFQASRFPRQLPEDGGRLKKPPLQRSRQLTHP